LSIDGEREWVVVGDITRLSPASEVCSFCNNNIDVDTVSFRKNLYLYNGISFFSKCDKLDYQFVNIRLSTYFDYLA